MCVCVVCECVCARTRTRAHSRARAFDLASRLPSPIVISIKMSVIMFRSQVTQCTHLLYNDYSTVVWMLTLYYIEYIHICIYMYKHIKMCIYGTYMHIY
jgi:hypothetical protein